MVKQKKIPLRKCVVTNEQHPKKEMIRLVKNSENKIFVDTTGKQNGRGAYLVLRKDVIDKAKKTKVLDRQFEAEVPDSVYEELYALLGKGETK